MPYFSFFWTDDNREHLAEHGVTAEEFEEFEEFEEVVQDPAELTRSRSTGNLLAFGYTSGGKFLGCVFEMLDDVTVHPITAYEPHED